MAFYRKQSNPTQPAGELRHRITFLRRTVTVKSGIAKESWETTFSCWADVRPLKGREFWSAAALNREHELRITIRFRRDVDAATRLQFDGVLYGITSIVNPDVKNVKLEILATSTLPDGKG